MPKISDLEIFLKTNLAEFQSDMKKAVKSVESAGKEISKITNSIGAGLAAVGAGAAFGKMIKEAADAEKILKKVEQTIRSTGGVAGQTSKSVQDLANEISNLTGVDDDAIVEAEGLLLTFTKIGKEVFPQATKAVVDLSEAFGQDLKSSAIQVGKALQDPVKGVAALSRVGVQFSETQKGMIKSLTETGRLLEAQTIILKELETQSGGAASAARDSLGGALKGLETTVNNLFQAFGASQGGGLRYAIEATIVVLDKIAANADKVGIVFDTVGQLTGIWAKMFYDTLIPAVRDYLNVDALFNRAIIQTGKNMAAIVQGKWGEVKEVDRTNLPGDLFEQHANRVRDALTDIDKEVKDRMAKISANAAKYKGNGGIVPEALGLDDKAVKKMHQELEHILKRGEELRAKHFADAMKPPEFDDNKEFVSSIEEASQEMAKWTEITTEGVGALAKQKEELIATLEKNKEKLRLLEAEKILGERIYGDQKIYNEQLAKTVEALKEMEKLRSDSKIKEKLDAYKEEQKYLEMTLEGREKEATILKEVDDALKSLNLTKEEEEKIRPQIEEEITKRNRLKDAIEAQKKAQKDLLDAQKKAYEEIKKWTDKVADGLISSITSGKSLKEVFKDLGKELAVLAAKKLLFEPLTAKLSGGIYSMLYGGKPPGQNSSPMPAGGGLTGWFKGLFGGGKGSTPAVPGVPGLAGLPGTIGNTPTGSGTGAPGSSSFAAMGAFGALVKQTEQGAAWKVYVVNCPCPDGKLAGGGGTGAPGGGSGGGGGGGGPVYSSGPVYATGPVTSSGSSSSDKKEETLKGGISLNGGLSGLLGGLAGGGGGGLFGMLGGALSGVFAGAQMGNGLIPGPKGLIGGALGGAIGGGARGYFGGGVGGFGNPGGGGFGGGGGAYGGGAVSNPGAWSMNTGNAGNAYGGRYQAPNPSWVTDRQMAQQMMQQERDRQVAALYNSNGMDPRTVAQQAAYITGDWNQRMATANQSQWWQGYAPGNGQGLGPITSGWGSMSNGLAIAGMQSAGGIMDIWDAPKSKHTPGISGAGGNYGGIGYALPQHIPQSQLGPYANRDAFGATATGGGAWGAGSSSGGSGSWDSSSTAGSGSYRYDMFPEAALPMVHPSLAGGSYVPGAAYTNSGGAYQNAGTYKMPNGSLVDPLTGMTMYNPTALGPKHNMHAPGYADGGRPPVGAVSKVGERGPELFVPDTAGTIIPFEKVRAESAAASKAPNVNLINNSSVQLEQQVTSTADGLDIRLVERTVAKGMRSRGGQRALKQTGSWNERPVRRA